MSEFCSFCRAAGGTRSKLFKASGALIRGPHSKIRSPEHSIAAIHLNSLRFDHREHNDQCLITLCGNLRKKWAAPHRSRLSSRPWRALLETERQCLNMHDTHPTSLRVLELEATLMMHQIVRNRSSLHGLCTGSNSGLLEFYDIEL